MTLRERWIIYPLLFLALGASLRDKLVRQISTDSLMCREVAIVDSQGRSLLRFTTGTYNKEPVTRPLLELNGLLSVVDGKGTPLLALGGDPEEGGGVFVTFSPSGRPAALLQAGEEDVRLDLLNPQRPSLTLGHSGGRTGLFLVYPSGGMIALTPEPSTTLPLPSAEKDTAPSAPEDDQPASSEG